MYEKYKLFVYFVLFFFKESMPPIAYPDASVVDIKGLAKSGRWRKGA